MSDFRKTNKQTEVVIIKKEDFNNRGSIQYDKLTSLIEKELRKRKNMRLSHIQNMDWGNNRNHFIGFILVFEERDETLTSIKQELVEIKERLYNL
ncbi:MAG: hypothetical protein P8Q95_04400 [Candidatus Poseidoniaceae archaeon]|nr:hypothetical protein [Candidatus Poseidoniaceae archaeon]